MLRSPFLCGRTPYLYLCSSRSLWSRAKQFAAVFAALLITLASANSLPASDPGLVGDWSFDEEVGTTADDLSGHGNTGSLVNGPEYIVGKFSYGLSFDGIDDYVLVPHSDSLDLSSELTISAWVHNREAENNLLANSEYHIIAAKGWAAAPGGSWTLAWNKKTNELSFLVRKSSDDAYRLVSFNSSNLTDEWHLITAVFRYGEISLYIDGLLAAGPISLGTNALNRNFEDVLVGAVNSTSDGAVYNWRGEIDEPRIYNRALTAAEISSLFEGTAIAQSFDFVLSNSGDMTVDRGQAAVTNVNAATIYGIARDVKFSVLGVPAGAKARLSLKKCKPDCTAILTIKTKRSTPTGNYLVTIVGQQDGDGLQGAAQGGNFSQSTSFNFTVTAPTVETPIITPAGGGYSGTVSVSLKSPTSGAAIHYTTDGTPPTQSSLKYKRAFTLSGGAVVRAKGFKRDYNASAEASAVFTTQNPFDFALTNSGNKSVNAGGSVQNAINAVLSSGTSEPVSFSVSGVPLGIMASFSSSSCNPSCSSTLTLSPSSSTPAGTFTITVSATGGGITKTTSFSLTVNLPTVGTPSISPNGGSYTGSVSVTMQSATAGAAIYYTTDGSTPTQSSMLYTGAMTLTSSAVVKAKAFKSGYNASGAASAAFTIAAAIAAPKLTLSWQDNSTNEANFRIERRTSATGTYVQIATVAANVGSYIDTAVVSGSSYCYRVQAVNSAGTSNYSNEGCAVAH